VIFRRLASEKLSEHGRKVAFGVMTGGDQVNGIEVNLKLKH
jgi:hypothetical protein